MAAMPKSLTLSLISLLIILPMAGCLTNADAPSTANNEPKVNKNRADAFDDYYVRHWGLGTYNGSINTTIPPFTENPDDLDALINYIHVVLPTLLEDCGPMPPFDQYLSDYGPYYILLIDAVVSDCGYEASYKENRGLTDEAIEKGEEEEYYHNLMAEAMQALSTFDEEMKTFSGPGSNVEVAVASVLAEEHWTWHHTVENLAPKNFAAWRNSSQAGADDFDQRLQLSNTYLNLVGINRSLALIQRILATYPFSEHPCTPSQMEPIANELEKRIAHGMALGKRYEVNDNNTLHSLAIMYGWLNYLNKTILPHYLEYNLWYGLVDVSMKANFFSHYYEIYNATILPTAEESLHLIFQFDMDNRTLMSDKVVAGVRQMAQEGAESPQGYEYRPALQALALPALANPYRWTDCHA